MLRAVPGKHLNEVRARRGLLPIDGGDILPVKASPV